jgi:hypothetical protein
MCEMTAHDRGVLSLSHPPGEIDPALPLHAFAQTPLGQACGRVVEVRRTRLTLDHAVVEHQPFRVELSYDGDRLDRLELVLPLPGDDKGWDGWTEAQERTRKKQAEAWAARVFGRPMEIKPFVLDDGTVLTPFETRWDSPRRLALPWGEVGSFYDSKGGFSWMVITYRSRVPEEQHQQLGRHHP